jgi:xanthine dehydrogenase accessory factor
MSCLVIIRGGGDLASGVALRLFRSGFQVIVTELPQPLAVRRSVSFAEAIYAGEIEIEGVLGRACLDAQEALVLCAQRVIPVLADPTGQVIGATSPQAVVDARMLKRAPEGHFPAEFVSIGLGPGFTAGTSCDAAIETKRGHFLGRVYWQGTPEQDTGIPEAVGEHEKDRVLRSPADGKIKVFENIGTVVKAGDLLAKVGGKEINAGFRGVLRGLIHDGCEVRSGMKIGDIDPRLEPMVCFLASDKALAVGGGVLEALLSIPRLRSRLCQTN